MAQTSDVGPDESWGWPCPYCRAHNPMDAALCANCGSQLRDPDEDDLFTTVAADNAEVVPPDARFARENMWTTDANLGEDGVDQGEFVDDDVWGTVDSSSNGNGNGNGSGRAVSGGSAFSAEPSERPSDVIDEPFGFDEPTAVAGRRPSNAGNLFSSGGARGADPRVDPQPRDGGPGRSPFGAPGVEPDGWPAQDRWAGAPVHGPGPSPTWGAPPQNGYPQPGPFVAPGHQNGHGAPPGQGYEQVPTGPQNWQYAPPSPPAAEPQHAPVPDPHGLSAAIGRLRQEDQDRAAIPISVCGALLQHDEVVLAAVTGQMLGHQAVVVLTNRRVLVVNGRRWQPIVDVFDVGPTLTVRGRHDRDVAALSFSDDTRLSTVDGITEVGLAVELAERIRPH